MPFQSIDLETHALVAALEALDDAVMIADRDGHVLYGNTRFIDLWRIPERFVTQADDMGLLAVMLEQLGDPDAYLAKLAALDKAPEASTSDVLRLKDGRVLERRSYPHFIARRLAAHIWTYRDVTGQMEHRDALIASEERFRSLTNASPDGIVCAVAGSIVFANPATERIFRCARRQLLGRPLASLFGEPAWVTSSSAFPNLLARVAAGTFQGREGPFSVTARRDDGEDLPVEVTMSSWNAGAERTVAAILRDMSHVARLEARAGAAARHAAAGTVAAFLSRELQGPAALVRESLVYSREALRAGKMSATDVAELVAAIDDAIDAATTVVEGCRDLATFASHAEAIVDVEINELVENAVRLAWPEVRRRALLVTTLEPSRMRARGDRRELLQVIVSLLLYAVSRLPETSHAENKVQVSTSLREGACSIVVRDSGPAWSEAERASFFGERARVENVVAQDVTGLEPAVAHSLVLRAGGEIRIESDDEDRSIVILSLPSIASGGARPPSVAPPTVRG
jgi:PAS domain S-box-containing protein